MNKYEIKGIVGEGAYGIVYQAKNKETGEVVAIKKFKESDDDEIVKKTTLREVKMLRSLKQENIVTLIDCFKKSNRLYLVFEYLEKNLLEILEERPNGLEPDGIRKYIYQLLKAIEFCHRQNVIHRDIKPENLLINPKNNDLRICDFGFARVLNQKAGQGLTDYVATRWYRAPELLLSNNYGKEVDIWAIGCIMGEITDGDPLFPGESEIDQLFCIQKILGALTPQQQEEFNKNPRFVGLKFPDITKPETLERRYVGKMSKDCLKLMNGMLRMDQSQRLTAIECLAQPYFDPIREPEIDRLIQAHNQLKLQQQVMNGKGGWMQNQGDQFGSACTQYSNPPLSYKDRRGESSKSRASVRSIPHGTADTVNSTNCNSEMRNKQVVYNQKFNLKESHKNTPSTITGNKLSMKQNSNLQQYAGNLQPQTSKYSNIHNSSQNHNNQNSNVVKKNNQPQNSNSNYGNDNVSNRNMGGVPVPQTNNFIPSSNLSQFLLKKGSNGSLHTFDNEYSYKINLDNLNNNIKTTSQPKKQSMQPVSKTKNHLFKEVIVEDEAEDLRSSQLGNDQQYEHSSQMVTSNQAQNTQNTMNPFTSTAQQQKKNNQMNSDMTNNLSSMNRESNSPTPQRQAAFNKNNIHSGGQYYYQQNDNIVANQQYSYALNDDADNDVNHLTRNGNKIMVSGGMKIPVQKKSITSGLNKLHRDSMGDTGGQDQGLYQQVQQQNNQQPVQQHNFYELPINRERERENPSNMGLNNIGAVSYDNTPANLVNRFSPKVSLGQDMSGWSAHGNLANYFQSQNLQKGTAVKQVRKAERRQKK